MRAISIRPKARQDLERIGDYTIKKWEQHLVVYLNSEFDIDGVRILHQRMDFEWHL